MQIPVNVAAIEARWGKTLVRALMAGIIGLIGMMWNSIGTRLTNMYSSVSKMHDIVHEVEGNLAENDTATALNTLKVQLLETKTDTMIALLQVIDRNTNGGR